MSHSEVIVRRDSYQDSVLLLRLSRELRREPGVDDAVVAMATPANLALLADAGYAPPAGLGANDLIIAVRGERVDLAAVGARLDQLLKGQRSTGARALAPPSLSHALREVPAANLVLISVPGEHAAREARRALALGRHVMIFSDNVSIDDEVALKREAAARGLLLMGPDCGTAILNGMPLAFANVVRRGPIGVVGASGTGIQEVTSLVHRLGSGVSQAIGTGGRDLSAAVGGAMTLLGIAALSQDPSTEVLVVVSKPPAPAVAEQVIGALERSGKKAVVHFVGDAGREVDERRGVAFADSLAGAAELACRLAGLPKPEWAGAEFQGAVVENLARRLGPRARLRGLFCGGTTGHEALVLLGRAGFEVHSNLHKQGALKIAGDVPVAGHVLLDLGDDLFTRGRPHPMIEPGLRNERLLRECADPEAELFLFDCVLGYGSHADPAGLLAEGWAAATAAAGGRGLVAVASVTGTDEDPQRYGEQRHRLEAAGIIVMPDNRTAARLAAQLLDEVRR